MADTLEQMLLVGMKDLSSRTLRCKLYSINILRVLYIYIYISHVNISKDKVYIYIYITLIFQKIKNFFNVSLVLLKLSLR